MSPRMIFAAAAAICAILAFAYFGSAPAVAQERPCVTPEAFFAESGTIPDFAFVGAAAYSGKASDLSVIFIANGTLYLVAFDNGCVVSNPIPLDSIVPADEAPALGGPLKGPKDEVEG